MNKNQKPSFSIRPMRIGDFRQALDLWRRSKGVGVRPDDNRTVLTRYLKRNSGISLVAHRGAELVGTILGGHDGRRGIIAHLAVAEKFRGLGLGRLLARECLTRLEKAGIARSYVLVFGVNRGGLRFWEKTGWERRKDLSLFVSRFKFPRKTKG
ncbi:MAG: GNAT family N-acetyltransferase [bacterium]